jgi:hypothetical protein
MATVAKNRNFFKWPKLLDQRTQFWKGAIQESFEQSLVEIGSVVSEEKIFFKFPNDSWMAPFQNCVR